MIERYRNLLLVCVLYSLFVLLPFLASAQGSLDSLAHLYASKNITKEEKWLLAGKYSTALFFNQQEGEGMQLLAQNIALCRKAKDGRYAAYLYAIQAMNYKILDEDDLSQNALDSALYYKQYTTDNRIRGYVSYCEGWLKYRDNKPVEAVNSFVEALKTLDLAKTNDYKSAIYKELYSIYAEWGDYGLQKKYAELTLDLAQSIKDISLAFDANRMLGGVYENLYREKEGEVALRDSAHYYYQRAISIYEANEGRMLVPSNLPHVALNLANLFMEFYPESSKPEAIKYAHMAIELGKKTHQYTFVASAYGILSEYEMQDGNIEGTKRYLLQAMNEIMQDSMADRIILSRIYQGLANVYEQEGDTEQSLHYYKQYQQIYKDIYDADKMEIGRRLEAQFEKEKQMQQLAYLKLEDEKKEQQLALMRSVAKQSEQQLANMALKEENQRQEIVMFKLQSEKNEQALSLARLRSEQHGQEKALMRQEIESNKKLNRVYFLLMLVFLLILVLVYYVYKQRSTSLKQQAEVHLLALQKVKQEQEISNLTAMLEGQEKERARLARDLHDGLGGLLSGTKIELSELGLAKEVAPFKSLLNRSLGHIDAAVDELRRVAHNLMPELVLKYGLKEAIKEFCSRVSKKVRVEAQIINYKQQLNAHDEVMVYRIIQELVNNGLKHGRATHILVQYQVSGDRAFLTVEDDGIGFDQNGQQQKGMGAGLLNIHSRLQYLQGEMHVDSRLGQGTTIEIEFPISKNI
ncbi:ATP-binding protein [Olivibacter sitiensis]|uniref:ATP-binding protein n=1 Tax=Olivibacter sitiensis TaxID=376470 RepID=UPI000424877E|nr:ATP-binding protein [Olivibacter sitiensis]